MLRKNNDTEKNTNKKLITFKNIDLINGIVQDRATLSDTSYSAIIEDILLKEFLPESKASVYYIEMIYKYGLKETFIALMQNLSAGINFEASQTNSYALVKLAMNIVSRPFSSSIDQTHKDLLLGHFPSNCEAVKQKIEHESSKKKLSFDEEQRLRDTLALLSLRDPQDFVPYNYFELVLANWEILGNYTFTFRMLYDVVALSDPALWDRPEHRLNAIDCIADVTSTWDIY